MYENDLGPRVVKRHVDCETKERYETRESKKRSNISARESLDAEC